MQSFGGLFRSALLVAIGLTATLAVSSCSPVSSLVADRPGAADAKAACQLAAQLGDPNTSASDGLAAIGEAADKAAAAASEDERYRPLLRALHALEAATVRGSAKQFSAAADQIAKSCSQV